jgi:hypothetical protein
MLFMFRLKPYSLAAFVPFAVAAVMFPERALRYIGYLVLVLMPSLLSGTVFDSYYETISLVIFLVVAFGLNVYGSRLSRKSFDRTFNVESAQLTTHST